VKRSLVQHLVCPLTHDPLTLEVVDADETGEVKTGWLHTSAGLRYPVRNWVPRFVEDDRYSTTFSHQRQYYLRHIAVPQYDAADCAELFTASTGFSLSEAQGLTLDAGCGRGRFSRLVGDSGSEVIGVDLSGSSVEWAFELVGRRENVHIVQADLARLPFRLATFRRIFSIGVLHHTPSTRESFTGLLPYLENGGEVAIWVYSSEKKRSANRWRHVTTQLPPRALYGWCVVDAALLSWLRSMPGGSRVSWLIPGPALNEGPFWERVIQNFDSLSPRYAHTHPPEEIETWFHESGLVDIERLARPSSVRGRKAAVAAERPTAGTMDHAAAAN
jgi:SAM-dependent methyltransferase